MKDNHLSKMKLLLSFLLLTTLTWQALAQSCPGRALVPPLISCPSCPPPSCLRKAAPCDQVARCLTDDPQYRHTYPNDSRVLMDSINYLDLIDNRNGVWQRQDVDGSGITWQQAGGICGHEVSVCEADYFNTGANRNNWFFTQYICYLDANEVWVNVTYDFTGCILACQPRVTFYRYERDEPNAAAARDPNNYDYLYNVTGRSGFGLNLGNTIFHFNRSSNTSHGFYIGVQDTGSCISIRRLTLYYRICPGRIEGVTVIPEIALPPLDRDECTKACCFDNAVPAPGTSLEIAGDADGVCTVDPECVCIPGYEFVADTANGAAKCRACPPGTYQARDSNDFSCQPCPANSEARDPATAVCKCKCNYNRPPGQPDEPCTRPPSSPRVAISDLPVVNGTSITVCWLPSLETGGRDDLYYNIYLLQFRGGSNTYQLDLTEDSNTNANPNTPLCRTLRNLTPGASYCVVITAANGATDDPDSFTDVSVVQDRFILFYVATGGDINECSINNGGCAQICTNTQGSFQCSCRSGYRLSSNRRSCDDINECTEGTHNCNQVCTNTQGSFRCSCRNGYRLNGDGRTCTDINECNTNNGGCAQICTNTQGSFQCSCGSGYRLTSNRRRCVDINECTEGTHNCNQVCTNTQGSFRCSCGNGYRLNSDGRTCDDINECNTNNGGCAQICINTQGSFQCSCRSGYTLNSNRRSCAVPRGTCPTCQPCPSCPSCPPPSTEPIATTQPPIIIIPNPPSTETTTQPPTSSTQRPITFVPNPPSTQPPTSSTQPPIIISPPTDPPPSNCPDYPECSYEFCSSHNIDPCILDRQGCSGECQVSHCRACFSSMGSTDSSACNPCQSYDKGCLLSWAICLPGVLNGRPPTSSRFVCIPHPCI